MKYLEKLFEIKEVINHTQESDLIFLEAVKEALAAGIKIYTIGIGKAGEYDKALLTRIAKDSNARMFGAENAGELSAVYSELDRLEPSKIHSEHYLNKQLYYVYPLVLALLLFLYLLKERKF